MSLRGVITPTVEETLAILAERIRHLETADKWQFGEIRNAKHFVVGSSTAGIVEARNDLGSRGGIVLLPPGNSDIYQTVTPVNNVWILGEGSTDVAGQGSLIRSYVNGPAFQLPDPGGASHNYNIHLEGFGLRDYGGSGTYALELHKFGSGCVARDIIIKGFNQGVRLEDSWYCHVENIGCSYQKGSSFHFSNCNGVPFINLRANSFAQTLNECGVKFEANCRGSSLIGGAIEKAGAGTTTYPGLGIFASKDIAVIGVYFESNRNQEILIGDNSRATTIQNVYLSGGNALTTVPLSIYDADDTVVLNSDIAGDAGGASIRVGAGCSRTLVIGGYIGGTIANFGVDTMQIRGDTVRMFDGDLNLRDASVAATALSQLQGIILKDGPSRPLALVNQSDVNWTDLDLTADTSARTRGVILRLEIKDTGGANAYLGVRKNGVAPAYFPHVRSQVANVYNAQVVSIPCDAGQVIEYKIDATGANTANAIIEVLGYWES